MSSLTVKKIPGTLHRQLRLRARQHRRSLNSEILSCLVRAVSSHPVDPETLIFQAQQLRQQVAGRLDDQTLLTLKVEGRL